MRGLWLTGSGLLLAAGLAACAGEEGVAPRIKSVYPAAGATNVSINTPVTIQFDRPVSAAGRLAINGTNVNGTVAEDRTSYIVKLPWLLPKNAVVACRAENFGGSDGLAAPVHAWSFRTGTFSVTASTNGGMGAIPYAWGTAFRVWAPNASAVFVAGNFCAWSDIRHALASEGNGYWSGDITNVAAGAEYRYVIHNNGNKLWKNDPYARQVVNSVGNSIVKDRNYTWANPAPVDFMGWHQMVIYELHPKTWTANIAGAGSPFAKIAGKVSYLKDDLAVNAVHIMPVAEFPGDQSWGYNPAHPFAVESSYGGYDGYKSMVDALHGAGIAVIQDVVHNHYGPSDLDLWCFDGPTFGGGGIYFFTDWRQGTPWGDSRPDYGRGEVRQYIRDNALYWLQEMGCDGLRWDATVYIRKKAYDKEDIDEGRTLLRWINEEVNAAKPGAIMIAEDLNDDNGWMTSFADGGCGFDSQWHARFIHPIRAVVKAANDADRDMWTVKSCIDWVNNGDHTRLLKYAESHDECAGKNGKQRLVEDIWVGNARGYYAMKRASLAVLLAILSPGIPMIFQGQENLEYGNWDDTVNFSWTDVAAYTASSNNYVHMLRDAIRIKRNWGGLTEGFGGNGVNVFHVNNSGKVVAFHRWLGAGGARNDVVAIFNFSNTRFDSYGLSGMPGNQNGEWKLRYNSDWHGAYVDWEGKFPAEYPGYVGSGDEWASGGSINFSIGPYSVLVYSQDP